MAAGAGTAPPAHSTWPLTLPQFPVVTSITFALSSAGGLVLSSTGLVLSSNASLVVGAGVTVGGVEVPAGLDVSSRVQPVRTKPTKARQAGTVPSVYVLTGWFLRMSCRVRDGPSGSASL